MLGGLIKVQIFLNFYFLSGCSRGRRISRVSCSEYYCYKLQIRPNEQSILLYSGRLFQQYVVDMYVKIETNRLNFIRKNQDHIRADLYQGLVDSVEMGLRKGSEIGKRIVLPATFIDGPRDMQRRYLDAMTLVRSFGKTDFFLTMTCNPNWLEIQHELKSFELAQNRPDLTARIFKAKLEQLKKEIIKKKYLAQFPPMFMLLNFKREDCLTFIF